MQKVISFVLPFSLSVVFIAVLNGSVFLPGMNIPPLGRLLNPFDGVWSKGLLHESEPITLEDERLTAKVEIYYDERRVPHIFAANMEDALFAQGFVEAQNRLFQMDFLSRAAAGELSAIFGERTLPIDLEKRRRGMRYAAENAVKGWEKAPGFQRAQRYVDGVNAWIEQMPASATPLEYTLVQTAPEPWTMVKSALVFKQMSQTLAGNNNDVEYTNLRALLGEENMALLYPERQENEAAVIPDGTRWQFDSLYTYQQDTSAIFSEPILNSFFPNRLRGVGSNSWGVSGAKTSTGHPIFCNDPHLTLSLPSIWFELHIHTPECNAYGVSFPGFPGIMIGFNEYIAWGETNVGQDVEDLFLIEWADSQRKSYLLDGRKEDASLRVEEIKIKGRNSVFDTVRYTHWGPVYRTSADGRHDLALRWLCHDIPDTGEFNVFIDAMTCRSYDDYLVATEPYISPAQNFGFASKEGDIAMRVNGRFPARPPGDGRFVEYGNQSANGWLSFIPRAQNPQVHNPARGYIASANQVSADKEYPYYFCGDFERFRNKVINATLDTIQTATPEDMQRMQSNAYSLNAAMVIRACQSQRPEMELGPKEKAALQTLASWDCHYVRSSKEAVLFELFLRQVRDLTWDEIVSRRKEMDSKLPEDWRWAELVEQQPANAFFDITTTNEKETAPDIIAKALQKAVVRYDSLAALGKSTWGAFRPLSIYHMTRLPALSVENIPVDGCPDAINATGSTNGPSWRMVVSLEEKVRAWGIYPGGQSGHPLSRYYKDMIPKWQEGEYYAINLYETPETLKDRVSQSITMVPTSSK